MWSYSDVSGWIRKGVCPVTRKKVELIPRHTIYQLEYCLICQPRESSNMFPFALSSASGCTTTKRERMAEIRPCRRNISDIPSPRLPFLLLASALPQPGFASSSTFASACLRLNSTLPQGSPTSLFSLVHQKCPL